MADIVNNPNPKAVPKPPIWPINFFEMLVVLLIAPIKIMPPNTPLPHNVLNDEVCLIVIPKTSAPKTSRMASCKNMPKILKKTKPKKARTWSLVRTILTATPIALSGDTAAVCDWAANVCNSAAVRRFSIPSIGKAATKTTNGVKLYKRCISAILRVSPMVALTTMAAAIALIIVKVQTTATTIPRRSEVVTSAINEWWESPVAANPIPKQSIKANPAT